MQGGAFTGLASKLANGGSNVLLSSDGAHWQSEQMSTINGQGSVDAAMTPTMAAAAYARISPLWIWRP